MNGTVVDFLVTFIVIAKNVSWNTVDAFARNRTAILTSFVGDTHVVSEQKSTTTSLTNTIDLFDATIHNQITGFLVHTEDVASFTFRAEVVDMR